MGRRVNSHFVFIIFFKVGWTIHIDHPALNASEYYVSAIKHNHLKTDSSETHLLSILLSTL